MPIASMMHATGFSTSVAAATTVETVIAVSDNVPAGVGGEGFAVFAELGNILGNAGASTCRLRIRQGTTVSGAIVADSGANTVPAAANFSTSCGGVDASPIAPAQYCLTILMSATAQAGTSTGLLAFANASSAGN